MPPHTPKNSPRIVGRGAQIAPANRYESTQFEADWEQLEYDEQALADERKIATQFFPDATKSLMTSNDSPDIGFKHSINPYRGCEHGCAYCYARPTHEYLDLGAGTDFDTKIVVKRDAAALLREAFDRPSWQGEMVMFSGVTDCYQPVERDLELTRRCLEVCLEYRNPVSVISKSALIERDLDLFAALTEQARFGISVSLAFSDNASSRAIEPWAPSPDRRFRLIETLAAAGIPVGVMCAPIIPGINDSQMVSVLERAAAAGAMWAGWVLLRLPGAVKQVFEDRVRAAMPLAADKVLHRIRETRGGELYDARFGVRGRGEGVYARMIQTMFDATVQRLGLGHRNREGSMFSEAEAATTFRRPDKPTPQLSLF